MNNRTGPPWDAITLTCVNRVRYQNIIEYRITLYIFTKLNICNDIKSSETNSSTCHNGCVYSLARFWLQRSKISLNSVAKLLLQCCSIFVLQWSKISLCSVAGFIFVIFRFLFRVRDCERDWVVEMGQLSKEGWIIDDDSYEEYRRGKDVRDDPVTKQNKVGMITGLISHIFSAAGVKMYTWHFF